MKASAREAAAQRAAALAAVAKDAANSRACLANETNAAMQQAAQQAAAAQEEHRAALRDPSLRHPAATKAYPQSTVLPSPSAVPAPKAAVPLMPEGPRAAQPTATKNLPAQRFVSPEIVREMVGEPAPGTVGPDMAAAWIAFLAQYKPPAEASASPATTTPPPRCSSTVSPAPGTPASPEGSGPVNFHCSLICSPPNTLRKTG